MKKSLIAVALAVLIIGIFHVPILRAVTASYNQTVRIVSSTGTVLNGVASAVSANYNETVRVVDSTGKVIDAFSSGGTNITAGAGDFSACTQTGASLNCTVVNSQGNALTSSTFGSSLNLTAPGAIGSGTSANGTFNNLNAVVALGTLSVGGTGNCTGNVSICTVTLSGGTSTINWATPPANQYVHIIISGGTNNVNFGSNILKYNGANDGYRTIQTSIQQVCGAAGAVPCSLTFWSDGTNLYMDPFTKDVESGVFYNRNGATFQVGFSVTSGLITLNGDNGVSTMARLPLDFTTSGITSTGVTFGIYKTVRAITIENFEGLAEIDTSCASGSTLNIYDCGTSAPANAACSGGTSLANVVLSTTPGTAADGTITSANVAAGHYIGAQISALGTSCTALTASISAMARPQ